MSQILIVGLGNPGEKYAHTRHNAGFLFVDFLRKAYNLPLYATVKKVDALVSKGIYEGSDIILLKPQTYMNMSGKSVGHAIRWYGIPPENVILCFDDLDIPLGTIKVQHGVYPKVHNGVTSVQQTLRVDTQTVRIGVDGRDGDRSVAGNTYALTRFPQKELTLLEDAFRTFTTNNRHNLLLKPYEKTT